MKKVYSAGIITLLLAVVASITLKVHFWTDSPGKLLAKAFQTSGAVLSSTEVYVRGNLKYSEGTGRDEMKKIALKLALGLGCSENRLVMKPVEEETLSGIEVNGSPTLSRSIAITAMKGKEGESGGKGYVTVSIVERNGAADMAAAEKKAVSILREYTGKAVTNHCIMGSLEGKPDNDRLNDICVKIFQCTDAHKVEGMSENNLISVSAYTPSIDSSIEVNGKKVNLNLAVRYNSYENRTYIWLATPVITTEY